MSTRSRGGRVSDLKDRVSDSKDRATEAVSEVTGSVAKAAAVGIAAAGIASGSAKAASAGAKGVDIIHGPIIGGGYVSDVSAGYTSETTSGGSTIGVLFGVQNNVLGFHGSASPVYTDKKTTQLNGTGTKISFTMTATTTGGVASNGTMKVYTNGKTYSAQTPSIKTGFTGQFTNSNTWNSPQVTFYAVHTSQTVSMGSNYTASLFSADTSKTVSNLNGSGTEINFTMSGTTAGGSPSKGVMKVYTNGKTYSTDTQTIKTGFTGSLQNTGGWNSPTVTFYASHSTTTVNITNASATLTAAAATLYSYQTTSTQSNSGGFSITKTYQPTGTVTEIYVKGKFYVNGPYGGSEDVLVKGEANTLGSTSVPVGSTKTTYGTLTGASITDTATATWSANYFYSNKIMTRTAIFYG